MTGCDSGLGYSLALHCRQLGAIVIASVLQIDGPGAKQLENENVLVYPLDVTKIKSIENFANSVRTVLTKNNLGKFVIKYNHTNIYIYICIHKIVINS